MPTFREDLHLGHKVTLVETDDIRNQAITPEKLAVQAVITELIADLAVTTGKLADLSVTTPKIAELAVVTSKLADLAVTTAKVAEQAITTEKIHDLAVITQKIADLAVTTGKIADLAVTEPKMADDSVSTRTIINENVTEPKMHDDSVSTRTIQENAVTEPKMHDNSVSTRTIQEKAVTEPKLGDESVSTRTLQTESVTHDKLHDDAVEGNNIKDKNIAWQKLNDDLQNIIASAGQHGVSLSNEWGDSTLIGLTQKMLSEALGNVHKDGDNFVSLQYQIDQIVSGGATVNLNANPSVIFANTATNIMLTASTNKNASSITITGGELSAPITGSGSSVSGTDQGVNRPVGTMSYLATFVISGLQRTASRTVSIANKIYYGTGQTDDVLNTDAMVHHTPAVAQPSFTQVITTELNDYIYFEVPSEMNNISKLELYDDPTFPTELTLESVATTRDGYKAFKTTVPRLAGTHTYKIS
jgi:hypothetical protein